MEFQAIHNDQHIKIKWISSIWSPSFGFYSAERFQLFIWSILLFMYKANNRFWAIRVRSDLKTWNFKPLTFFNILKLSESVQFDNLVLVFIQPKGSSFLYDRYYYSCTRLATDCGPFVWVVILKLGILSLSHYKTY